MRRRILILLAAAMLAMVSVAAVVAYARGADRRALQGQTGRWVLLATTRIPDGTTVAEIRSKKLTRQVLMPAQTVPSGALDKLDRSLDAMALSAPLQPDQLLLRGQFGTGNAPTASPSPTFPLPADKIAVSVDLGMAPQVAGNVDPGDKVVVFLTYPKVPSGQAKQVTAVLLPSVTVISVGERSPRTAAPPTPAPAASPSSASPAPAPTPVTLQRYVVTVAVTPAEGERLIFAYNTGLLHLGLLGSGVKVTPEFTWPAA
ncbi:hypothetical protein HH310_34015 [Actinoplanes sp. TBRC 11911]|uniref:RcpC/CpaB family pilus assembly protein n=1 Tax=Actinoplanes sp. TBRC 11911 TaxID=2729386 RepID=UPI00145DD262|nr:RcpC/CpaB family pilus assembly protein [Actinoplanes sp. TBRC 11911]NMO56182.1 hypothetical protein [Actinoplanes sp. TBRC 11911]